MPTSTDVQQQEKMQEFVEQQQQARPGILNIILECDYTEEQVHKAITSGQIHPEPPTH